MKTNSQEEDPATLPRTTAEPDQAPSGTALQQSQNKQANDASAVASTVQRQAMLEAADVRTHRPLQESILSPMHNRLSSSSMMERTSPTAQRYKILSGGNNVAAGPTPTNKHEMSKQQQSQRRSSQLAASGNQKKKLLHTSKNFKQISNTTAEDAAGGNALVNPEQLYTSATSKQQSGTNINNGVLSKQSPPHALLMPASGPSDRQLNINITGSGQVIQNPTTTLGISTAAAHGMGIQMGTDGKFYASTMAASQVHSNDLHNFVHQQHHVSPHFTSHHTAKVSSLQGGRESILTQQKLQVVEKPTRFAFKKSVISASPAMKTTPLKILSASQRRDSCGPVTLQDARQMHQHHNAQFKRSPTNNQADSQKFYTTGGLFDKSAIAANEVADGHGQEHGGRPPAIASRNKHMNSTNETSFTEIQDFSTNQASVLLPNVVIQQSQSHQNRPPPMLVSGYHSNQHQQQSQQQKQANQLEKRFTLLKARGEQGSKQLKHDVAQQIIDSANANGMPQYRKSIQMQQQPQQPQSQQNGAATMPSAGQQQLPTVEMARPMARTELCSPLGPSTGLQQLAPTSTTSTSHMLTANEQLLLSQHQNYYSQASNASNQLKKNTGGGSGLANGGNMLTSPSQLLNSNNLQKHNSMELLLATKAAAGRNSVSLQQQAQTQSLGRGGLVQDAIQIQNLSNGNGQQQRSNQIGMVKGLSYRMMSEKRASQPPSLQLSSENTQHLLDPASLNYQAQQRNRREQLLFHQHMEHIKRNSVQISAIPQTASDAAHATNSFNVFLQSPGLPGTTHTIYKQEVTLVDSANNSVEPQQQFQPQPLQPLLSPENAEWIRKAIQASKNSSQTVVDSAAGEGGEANGAGRQAAHQQQLTLGSPTIQAPQGTTITLTQKNSPKNADRLQQPDSPKRADLTDSNVKRARLMLDKKKKQLDQQVRNMQQKDDPRWRLSHQNYSLEQMMQMQQQFANSPTQAAENSQIGGNAAGDQSQIDGILIGSGIAASPIQQQQLYQQQSSQSPHLQQLAAQHPLSNQQLINGYQKAGSTLQSNIIAALNRRGLQQERAFQQNQGIQGRNMAIQQSYSANQRQQQSQQLMMNAGSSGNLEADLLYALSQQITDPEDFKALEFIQSQLQQYNSLIKKQQSPKNQKKKELIVFNHDGQTYVRNNETSSTNSKMLYLPMVRGQSQEDKIIEQIQQRASQSPKIANILSQLKLNGPNSLLQGAQFEAALKQVLETTNKSPGQKLQNFSQNAHESQHSEAPLIQTFTMNGAALLNTQSLTRQIMNKAAARGRSERPVNKFVANGSSFKHQSGAGSSPLKNQPNFRQQSEQQSNGSLSTKPATSTTLSSQHYQGSGGNSQPQILSGNASPTKKGRKRNNEGQNGAGQPSKQKVQIYHEWWHEADSQILRTHKINKAINTINNIIRLIFKNSKDSLAITTTNTHNTSSLAGPAPNRLSQIDDTRITELQKIAKQINISIPRKFDSKSSLREFFYSREFILNVKIKMQNLLHKAILSANNLSQSIIEANMCGNLSLVTVPNPSSSANKGNSDTATEQQSTNKIYQAKKFHVGPGNNYPIVKSVLKQRYWWQYGAEESFAADCDFIWTAWKKQKHIDFLSNVNQKVKTKAANTASKQQEHLTRSSEVPSSKGTVSSSKKKQQQAAATISGAPEDQQQQQSPNNNSIDKVVLPLRLYNKLEQNKQLTNKKGVFVNMRRYYESLGQDPFKVLPLTFHTQHGVNDPEYRKFENYFNQVEKRYRAAEQNVKQAIKQYYIDKGVPLKNKNKGNQKALASAAADEDYGSEVDTDDEESIDKIKRQHRVPQNTWIVKPGENTNRGQGITVVKTLREVQSIIGRPLKKDGDRTFIIQKYIDYPLLVHKRKFDFRCFGLLTSVNGSLKGYCYQDGYIRTSCREYSLDDVSDQFVHLTNDAIQQKADDYGKFENGNKLSWQDFTKVVCAQQPHLDFDFHRDIFPQIQKLIADTYKASFTKIDPQRLQNSFELFGYDFMIDENFRLYLIEVNTNPCLEVCCPLLARIIPEVLDNSFKIVLDPLFPSPDLSHNRKFQLNELPQEVKFQLVFDEATQGEQIKSNSQRGTQGLIREAVGEEEDIESDKENELAEDDDVY